MTDELSDEMQEAIRILRSDERAKAFRDMTASNQALVERLDKKDADDAAWRKELAERNAQSSGSPVPTGDPSVGNPTPGGPGQSGNEPPEGGPPPAPEVIVPEPTQPEKKKSRWWGDMEDD